MEIKKRRNLWKWKTKGIGEVEKVLREKIKEKVKSVKELPVGFVFPLRFPDRFSQVSSSMKWITRMMPQFLSRDRRKGIVRLIAYKNTLYSHLSSFPIYFKYLLLVLSSHSLLLSLFSSKVFSLVVLPVALSFFIFSLILSPFSSSHFIITPTLILRSPSVQFFLLVPRTFSFSSPSIPLRSAFILTTHS